ncbi:PREDICTED: transcription factor TFIIIB component B'' homolog [Dipodomys ordii]|uniref:Transcription factor TFIIIB component B'' homolog n=1 Tax=Dipodomys ordii TaxID=10020 RepID=A0A1S3F625_DIPOR|nr:PREDICTED: transcription factor TFIIIB component B'' homolog [Dipodomys ordii]
MFRRARLSVKPNVRPGVGARGSTAPQPQRGRESPRPPEPAAEFASKTAESAHVPAVASGGSEPQEKAPVSRDENTGGEHKVEESTNVSTTASQRRKRVSSTSSVGKPSVSVPSQSHPLSTVNQDTSQPNPITTREKQPCSDRYRIYKAQKLREMLKEELRKEKKQWKNKYGINESQKIADRSKMTMRDFIYYLPDKNPMASSLEQEKKNEKSVTPVQTREYLTVEVLRTKGPCVVEENDPIFERGSTTTYSSFRKNCYSKPWSNKETDMFFLAISMVGTDFSMIGQLFPHRARIEIKNKFKREEKTNGWRIDKAFQEKRPFDFDFFAHLLQKVLAEEEKRKQKSVKNQSLKEKSSKPRKNVKVKKVTNVGVNDEPDESVSTKISDTERSLKDAQTVEEESQISSGQDSEQVVLEQDQNQKKRKRKNQDETNEQQVETLLGNVTVHTNPSESEVNKSNSQVLCPETSEECSTQQLSCRENVDDIVGLVPKEKVEKRIDPILPPSNQPDTMRIASKSSESSTSDLPPSEVGDVAFYEVNNSDSSCTEGKHVDLEKKAVEIDQAENIKPLLRVRHQRPKPNLSRAIGKKLGKTDAENKSSQSDNSVEKDSMEKEKRNVIDSSELESTRREDSEADTVSTLSEKTCLQEDNQPKACKTVRPMRGRLQRPKPNVGKALERKMITPQEKIGDNIEKNGNESCVDRDITPQTTDQTFKNFQCEDTISESEKTNSPFQNVLPDESKDLNQYLSIPEDNETNVLKQVSIQRTLFQKPKPNIGRRNGKREISSKGEVPEEILVSQELTATSRETVRLDTSPGEKVPSTTASKELDSDLKATGRSDISPSEIITEMTDITGETETDLKGIERDISPKETVQGMIDITVETETALRSARKEVSSKETIPELIDTIEENDTNLEESGKEIVPQESGPDVDKPAIEMEMSLKETGKERTSEMIVTTNKRDLEETEGRERSALLKAQEEAKTIDEMKIYLKEIRGESSQGVKVLEEASVTGKREIDFNETGKEDISLMEVVSGRLTAIEETEADFKDTGREISEGINITKEVMADLEEDGNIDISPKENAAEESGTSKQNETNVLQSSSSDCIPVPSCDMENIRTEAASVMCTSTKEKESSEKEVSSHLKTFSQSSGLCEADQVVQPTDNADQVVQPTDNAEHLSASNLRTQKQDDFQQKTKENVNQTALPLRGRLHRPKPNIRKARQRQIMEKGEAEDKIKTEGTITQKDEMKKSLAVSNAEIDTEIEVVSSKVSECRMDENESHVVPAESLPVDKTILEEKNILEEKIRCEENKPCVPSPAQLIRRFFQKPKPNLSRANSKKGAGMKKSTTDENKVCKPEDNLLQQGDSDTQLLVKEKTEILTSLEVSARKDCVGSEDCSLAQKYAQLDVGPSRSVEEETGKNNSVSSIVQEQHLSKPTRDGAKWYMHILGNNSNIYLAAHYETSDYQDWYTKSKGLEITENVADVGCVTVVEHQLPHMDVTTQEVKQGKDLYTSSFEMTSGEQAPSVADPSDGSTEAAITLLTMGDIVLQSEISTDQGDVGVCIFHSEDGSHIPFSTENVNHKPVDEYQEFNSLITSASTASLEDRIVSEERTIGEKVDLMEEIKETTPTRNAVSQGTSNLRMRSRFVKPKSNFEKISDTSMFDAHKEVSNFCIAKGEEKQSQRETEQNVSKATELEDKTLGPVTTAENKEQNQLTSIHCVEGTSIPLEANLVKRNEEEEERAEVAQVLSVTSVSPETVPHTLGSSWGLCESSMEETLRKESTGESVLTFHAPECTSTSIPEVQQKNVINPEDLAVNLFANIHQDGDDEQAVILTLVEIPTSEAGEFTGDSMQLMPNPLLPAPILIKSGNTEERSDLRGYCSVDTRIVPEVCSKESNVSEATGLSYKRQGIFPASESLHTTPEHQNEQLDPTFQNTGSVPHDNIRDLCEERNMVQLPQDEMIVSDKEERSNTGSKSEQIDKGTLPSKAPLTRYHEKCFNKCSSESLIKYNLKVCSDQPSLKEECKSGQKRAPEDEPPTVSEYYFGDIFIEMDEIV